LLFDYCGKQTDASFIQGKALKLENQIGWKSATHLKRFCSAALVGSNAGVMRPHNEGSQKLLLPLLFIALELPLLCATLVIFWILLCCSGAGRPLADMPRLLRVAQYLKKFCQMDAQNSLKQL
jgi:hypothetical protein